ncbi:MAG: tRNA (N6-threonylcarbamoyladenosine(37)-N6)-methyltransferase TrmO [Deltaproteobacteria bacterium]|jgi:tRNA-Thr(GGU) m(6)t(6)A37 methyltransferase TsaA|nr:tRNA (N6-threonylcarbamoyladenosine(37)-N6)-methyltransferase TrmO [Deltaproteobacteria bacterium]
MNPEFQPIKFKPVGIIHTPFKERKGMPIQPVGGKGVKAQISIFSEYQAGLKDLEGFSHIYLLFHLHRSDRFELQVFPFLDKEKRGVFATRAPNRPNPIGLSIVKLDRIKKNIIHIENVDMLDGTPLLDIKPYVPEFNDNVPIKTGWLEKARGKSRSHRSDDRFIK